MGALVPLIPPAQSAEYVAGIYSGGATLHRIGLILGMVGVCLTISYFLVISMQMRRMERRVPILSILRFASGIIVTGAPNPSGRAGSPTTASGSVSCCCPPV